MSAKCLVSVLRSIGILAVLGSFVGSASARDDAGIEQLSPEERALVEQARNAVIQELQRGGLSTELKKGVRSYLQEQKVAREAAREAALKQAEELAKTVQPVSTERDHILGNTEAVVSLIEYADFKCPYCKSFHSTAFQVVTSYGDKVNWVYRHLPMNFNNPDAQKLAEASECVAELGGNQAFWTFTDRVLEQAGHGRESFPLDSLEGLIEEMGLDGAMFQQCVDSGRMAARVREDAAEAGRVGFTGTPGNILLNRETGKAKVLPGNEPATMLRAAIDELLTPTTN